MAKPRSNKFNRFADPLVEQARLKVFISYSRAQVVFADQLELALRDKGFDVLIDRHSIAKGEDFQTRLRQMILECDTVVFVLSDESVSSTVCGWEVAEAQQHAKRTLVVTLGDVSPGMEVPPALAGIDWIHCWSNPKVPGSSVVRGLIELNAALTTNIGWIRTLTDLQAKASHWFARGALNESPYLLRGDQVDEALDWVRSAPNDKEIPESISRFIVASEEHERRSKSKAMAQARRVRRVSLVGGGVALVLMVAAIWLGMIALSETHKAERAQAEAARRSSVIVAREADALGMQGRHDVGVLMALYADPAARGSAAAQAIDGREGYADARDSLTANLVASRLVRVVERDAASGGVAFSPDGKLTLIGTEKGLKLRTLDTNELLHIFDCDCYNNASRAFAFSPDGRRIAAGYQDQVVRIWDTATGTLLFTLGDHRSNLTAVAFSPDGKVIASMDHDQVRLWDSESGNLLFSIVAVDEAFGALAFSRDSEELAIGKYSGQVEFWRIDSGSRRLQLSGPDYSAQVLSLSYSFDNRKIAVGRNASTELRDAQTGKLEDTFDERGFPEFSSADELLLVNFSDGLTFENSALDPVFSIPLLNGWDGKALSPDGRYLLLSSDGEARLWKRPDQPLLRFIAKGNYDYGVAAFSHDGRQVLLGTGHGPIEVRDVATGQLMESYIGHTQMVAAIARSGDGDRVVSASDDGTIRIWRRGYQVLAIPLEDRETTRYGLKEVVNSIAFSPDGRQIAGGSSGGIVRIWDSTTGKVVWKTEAEFAGGKFGFSPDGSRVATLDGLGGIQIRAAGDGRILTAWEFDSNNSYTYAVAYSHRGDRIATVGDKIRIWSSETGALLLTLSGHTAPVRVVAFSPDDAFVLSGDEDGSAKLWSSSTGRLQMSFDLEGGLVQSADFSPDGHQIITSSLGQGTQIWTVPSIYGMPASAQVEAACNWLRSTNLPLAFMKSDIQTYRVLVDQAADPQDPTLLLSPCDPAP